MPFVLSEHENDPEFKKHIADVLAPISRANDGLKADIATLKTRLKAFEGIDLEALKAAQAELEQLRNNNSSNETELQKQLRIVREQLSAETERLKNDVKTLVSTNRKLLVDDALQIALINANCDRDLIKAAISMIKPDVVVVKDEHTEMEVAKIGDKTIAEYIGDWAKTEVGKKFVLARSNRGGGTRPASNEDINAFGKFFDKSNKAYNVTEQVKLKRTNLPLYNALKAQYE